MKNNLKLLLLTTMLFIGVFIWQPTKSLAQSTSLNFVPFDSVLDAKEDILYVTDGGHNTISRVHYKTRKVEKLTLPYPAERMVLSNGMLYVTQLKQSHLHFKLNDNKGAIAVIDTKDFTLNRIIDINMDPYDLAVDKDEYLYVTTGSGQFEFTQVYNLNDGDKTVPNDSSGNKINMYEGTTLYYNEVLSKVYYVEFDELQAFEIEKGLMTAFYSWPSNMVNWRTEIGKNANFTPDGEYLYNSATSFRLAKHQTGDMIPMLTFDESYKDFAFNDQYTFGISKEQGIDVYTYDTTDYLYTLLADKKIVAAFADDGLVSIENINNTKSAVFYQTSIAPEKLQVANTEYMDEDGQVKTFIENQRDVPLNTAFSFYVKQKITDIDPSKVTLKTDSGQVVPVKVTASKNVIKVVPNTLDNFKSYVLTFEKGAFSGYKFDALDTDITYHFKTKEEKATGLVLSKNEDSAPERYIISASTSTGRNVEYEFSVNGLAEDPKIVQPFSTNNTFIFNPRRSDSYTVTVKVRSKESANEYDEKRTLPIKIEDKEKPKIHIGKIYNRDTNTVTLDISATDNSKVKSITLPNGEKVEGDHANYTMNRNTSYIVHAEDIFGNIQTLEDQMNLIDMEGPKITTSLSTNKATAKDIIVSIKASDNVGIKKLTLPDGTTTSSIPATFKVTKNGEYKVIAEDYSKHKTTKTFYVTKIFKKSPKTPASVSINDNDNILKGKGEPFTNVVVKTPKKTIKIGIPIDGIFSYIIPELKAGTKLTIYAKNPLGQKSKAITVTVKDKTAPKIKTASINSSTIRVFTEPNATIYVYKNTKKLKTLKASSKGTARGTIQTYKKGTEILIYVKDKAGNKSKVKKVKVQ